MYLVYAPEMGGVYAMKTFRDEFLTDQEVRKRFKTEASIWVDLERHPYIVRAYFVDELSGRLYIAMEYIAPNEDGLNTLEGYLQRRPPDLAQSLRWAIQICHGMEHAYSKGVRAHRDLKPANIMISQEKIAKITDFGLAGVFSEPAAIPTVSWDVQPERLGLSGQTMKGKGFGTPTHMAPEQFDNAAGCDERSDIYSFGIILYQMAAGGQLPFLARLPRDGSAKEMETFWRVMNRLQSEAPVPRLDSPLFPIIQRCLEKSSEKRYQTFREARKDLEPFLQRQTGEVIIFPQGKELEIWEWINKGVSLDNLGRYEEAIRCYEKALELDPSDDAAWHNKGGSLHHLGLYEEAIICFDKALELDAHNEKTWNNKGALLNFLNRYDEAIPCCDRALELDPRDGPAWYNKGVSLHGLGRYEEAISCYNNALELDPRLWAAWHNKGNNLDSLGRHDEAIRCYDEALQLDPLVAAVWYDKGSSLNSLGGHEEAIRYYDKALELDPNEVAVWIKKGNSFDSLGHFEEAIRCFEKALELNPRDPHCWYNKGNELKNLGRYEEAIRCYDQTLEIDPRNGSAWISKGNSLVGMGRFEQAIRCFDSALEIDPHSEGAMNNKAIILDSLGKSEQAADDFQTNRRSLNRAIFIPGTTKVSNS